MFKLDTNILINSNGIGFIFTLTESRDIFYTVVNSSFTTLSSNTLVKGEALKYAIIMDSKDILHLITLLRNGDLVYYRYDDDKWSHKIIGNFDIRSNHYNQIEITMIKNQIHIIYNFSNLISSNLWNLQHVIYENQERYNVIQYVAPKKPSYFVTDVDSQGTIYLLYSAIANNKSQIYYIFYNPFTNTWSSKPKLISLDKSNNHYPFLFIDSRDNIHSLWLEELRGRYFIKYIKMNSRGKEKFVWKEIRLTMDPVNYLPPIIYQEKNILKLQFSSYDKIETFFSEDFGETWSATKNYLATENIVLTGVNSNLEPTINRIKYGFSNLSSDIKFYFLNDYFHKQDNKNNKVVEDTSEKKSTKEEKIEEEIDELKDLNNKVDLILEEYNTFQSHLKHIEEKYQALEEELQEFKYTIQEKNIPWYKKIFN